MIFELIYTSAPRGIKAGTRGYCTVAFTEGMPSNYVQLAESLSGYRTPETIEVSPVAFSHYRFVVGGQRLSVLSRVTTAAYADYTGRRPTIAHHILIEQASVPAECNPALIMADPSSFVTEWHDEPRLIKKAKVLPRAATGVFAARQWERLSGDAAWAGVLAQSALEAVPKPAYIIFNPGRLDPLPLLAESLNLLPPAMRWTITFNTFFAGLPHDTTCLWRCCMPDSPALREMRATPGALSLDLTKSLGRATHSGPLVEAARTGSAPCWPQRKTLQVTKASPVPSAPRPASKPAPFRMPRRQARPVAVSTVIAAPAAETRVPSQYPRGGTKEKRIWPVIVATASVTAIVMSALGFLLHMMQGPSFPKGDPSASAPVAPRPATDTPTVTDQQAQSKPPLPSTPDTPRGDVEGQPPLDPPEEKEPIAQEGANKDSKTAEPQGSPPPDVGETAPHDEGAGRPAPGPALEWRQPMNLPFHSGSIEIPYQDESYTNRQYTLYFQIGKQNANPKKKLIGPDYECQLPATKLAMSVDKDTIRLSGSTNKSDYPIAFTINRASGEGAQAVVWLQTARFTCPFDTTVAPLSISVPDHPSLTKCLFLDWPTNAQPWADRCSIRFKNAKDQDLKNIPFEIIAKGKSGYELIVRYDAKTLDERKKTIEKALTNKHAKLSVSNVVMEYLKCNTDGSVSLLHELKSEVVQAMTNKLQEMSLNDIVRSIDNENTLRKQWDQWNEFLEKGKKMNYPKGGDVASNMLCCVEERIKEEHGNLRAEFNKKKQDPNEIDIINKRISDLRGYTNILADVIRKKELQTREGTYKSKHVQKFFPDLFNESIYPNEPLHEYLGLKDMQAYQKLIALPFMDETDTSIMIVEIWPSKDSQMPLLSFSQEPKENANRLPQRH